MARTVSVGNQSFDEMREKGYFLVDKTAFVRDWWESGDGVTLICRPRRFGKTLTLSMIECFFSTRFAGRGEELFGGLDVWDDLGLRALQGTIPTIRISLSDAKGISFDEMRDAICDEIAHAWRTHACDIDETTLGDYECDLLRGKITRVKYSEAARSLNRLCELLHESTGSKVIVLIDEYDTPLQESWVEGCWKPMVTFVRRLFNATLKTNTHLARAIVTGITRMAQESIFSDFNNLEVIDTFSVAHATSFGFTEREVASALSEFNLGDFDTVRYWYDGFSFGGTAHIYNPWSVTKYVKERKLEAFWANTSSNKLVSTLVQGGDAELKADVETLLSGGSIHKLIDSQVVFQDLEEDDDALWCLLLAGGYVRADNARLVEGAISCDLSLTNHEIVVTFNRMVHRWFKAAKRPYNEFVTALLAGDARTMTRFLSEVALKTFSSFDSGVKPSEDAEPERFWHGFVLGLLVDLRKTHQVLSNREREYGRYDTMIIPRDTSQYATVLEFKVVDPYEGEHTLEDAVASSLNQIARRDYDAELKDRGFTQEQIRHFGVAFEGKHVLVG